MAVRDDKGKLLNFADSLKVQEIASPAILRDRNDVIRDRCHNLLSVINN